MITEVTGPTASPRRAPVPGQVRRALNHLVDASGASFDTAGSLRGGRQVFVTMCLPETILIGGVDELDLFIAALNSHDGNSAPSGC